jgi:hypothetical protein
LESVVGWDVAEAHVREGLTLCDATPVRIAQSITRECHADMLMVSNAGDDPAFAAMLYAQAAESNETIALVLYASRLAEKRAQLSVAERRRLALSPLRLGQEPPKLLEEVECEHDLVVYDVGLGRQKRDSLAVGMNVI